MIVRDHGIWSRVKDLGEIYMSLERELNNNWKPTHEIDSREKAEDYNKIMEDLNQKKEYAFKEFMTERDIFTSYQLTRQTELMEGIYEILKRP